MPVRLDSCTARRRTMHSPPLDAAELRLYCADGHDPDTYHHLHSHALLLGCPAQPRAVGPADAAHRRGQTSAGSASCGGAVQHSTSFPPPGGTSPNQCGNAGLHRSHTRVDRPTAPSDPALCPPGCAEARKKGAAGVVVAGVMSQEQSWTEALCP